jgi:DNA-binding response OmpR family regulator
MPIQYLRPLAHLGLIVEDDREIREMVTMMVKSMGYDVATAVNGKTPLRDSARNPLTLA